MQGPLYHAQYSAKLVKTSFLCLVMHNTAQLTSDK